MLTALVAGAGPAGSTLALLLSRARKGVCVYERAQFPRVKPCGEYLSAGSVRLLYELGVGEQLARRARPVRGVRLHGYGAETRIDFPDPGWALSRAVLDEALLEAALSEGARCVRAHVEDCSETADGARLAVRLPDGTREEVTAFVVAGADGLHSIVARKCGLAGARDQAGRFAFGGHYRGFARLDEYIDMFVHPRGYLAVNPLDGGTANVMLVLERRDIESHREELDAFMQEQIRELSGGRFDDISLFGKRVAAGPLSYRAQRAAANRVVLVGDAACFVDPFTGQGVYLAMAGARIAAECIVSGGLRAYEERLRDEIDSRTRAARSVRRFIGSAAWARGGAMLMRYAPWALRSLVSGVTGT